MQQSKPAPIVGVILLSLSALLAWGLLTFARPCDVMADGAITSCYWAHRALLGADAVLGIIALVRVFELDEGERRGLSFCAALMGCLIACTPGWLIGLCADQTATCHTHMRPLALGIGAVVALVGGTDLVRRLLAIRKH